MLAMAGLAPRIIWPISKPAKHTHQLIIRRMVVPLYEYECAKCHHRFEKIESFSAPEKQKCPKCGATAGRVLTAPAIQFKGSGWYVTDYAGKSAGSTSSGSEAPKTSGESGSSKAGSEKAAAGKTSKDKKD